MGIGRRGGLFFVACAAAGMLWAWPGLAAADPVVASVVTSSDYETVIVEFTEPVEGSGTDDSEGEIIDDDVEIVGADASLVTIQHEAGGDTVVLGFDGPIQPDTSTIRISDAVHGPMDTGVPLAADDWAAIDASLRSIEFPVVEVPIAPYLLGDEGQPRSLDELLPLTMATSLDLPASFSVLRDSTDGTFELTVDGSAPLATIPVAPAVVLEDPGGVPYTLDLTSDTPIDLAITLDGTIEHDATGAAAAAALDLGMVAVDTPTLTGGIGVLEATVASDVDLDVSIGFDLDPATDDSQSIVTATASLGDVTINGLGVGGANIGVSGADLLTIDWPSLPGLDAQQERIETAVVTDAGWGSAGLQQLANVGLGDLLGAPGGVASWLGAAQTVGPMTTSLPVVDDTLGDAVGIAQSLAAVHDQVSTATGIAFGPLAPGPSPLLTDSLCADLAPSAVRAAEVEEAIQNLGGTPSVEDILAELPNVSVDESQITTAFTTACEMLFGSVAVDLAAGEIETEIDIPQATFDFFGGETPSIDLAFDEAGLGALGVGLDGGTWSGTAVPTVAFPLGLKLDPAADLVAHGLAVDLDSEVPADPPVAPDEGDVTAAYRIYIPEGQPIASSAVSILGDGLTGFANLGFVDLDLTGSVAITPQVEFLVEDPSTGFDDDKVDLLELLGAVFVDEAGETEVDDVLDVQVPGDDVDIHFSVENDVIAATAGIDIAGDVTGLLLGNVDVGTAAIGGPGAVDPDRLGIGVTFDELLDLAEMSPTEVVALVADLLDHLATSAAVSAGDERIPVVDVSVNEVAGFTHALADVASTIRDRVPTTVSELEAFVNDALADNGLGVVTVGFDPGSPGSDPELTLTIDGSLGASETYPITFELPGGGDLFQVAPTDGGAQIETAVAVGFQPVLGLRFPTADEPLADRLFVRDVEATFDFFVGGTLDGSVTFGPAEASVGGAVSIGNENLDGGFSASLTTAGDPTIPLSAILDGAVDLTVGSSIPVDASFELEVPTPLGAVNGTVEVAGTVPGTIEYDSDLDYSEITDYFASLRPNLRTLAEGTIETSRFIARGADEIGTMSRGVPVVGEDFTAQFAAASTMLDDVADEIQGVVDLLESDGGDAVTLLQSEVDDLLTGCGLCSADVRWTPDTATSILDAEGIEIALTLAGETGSATSTNASFGLEPVIDLGVDVTDASASIGFVASVGLGVDIHDGFYVFPGVDPDPNDGVGTLLELYADLDLASDIAVSIGGVTATADDATVAVAQELDENGDPVGAARLKVEAPDRLLISDLVNRSRALSDVVEPSFDVGIAANIPVAVGLELVEGEPVTVLLPLEFEWEFADTLSPDIDDASFAIVDATLDIGALAGFLADVVVEIDSEYNPLSTDEIKAALDAPVPLIDETVRDALLAVCDLKPSAGCTAFQALTGLNDVAAQLDALTGADPLPLGSFQIFPAPSPGTSRYTPPGATAATTVGGSSAPPPAAATSGNSGVDALNAKLQELTRGYMTAPILEQPSAVMGIVLGGELGEDVDIVRFEIPANQPIVLGKFFAIKRTLLDLDVAFLEGDLSVNLNGGIGLNISGGFGYSTRGITTGNFFDGIFLIDNETIEVGLGATVNAEVNGRFAIDVAGVDLASVRFRGAGSFSALGGIDLFDESPVLVGRGGGDGRLYFDEIATIADAYHPPLPGLPSELCMFQLRTTGQWSLSFSGKAKVLGITVFNESFDEGGTLWDETLSCQIRPRIARVEDRRLILHAGPNAGDRFDGEGDVAETFVLTKSGTHVVVSWPGSGKDPLSFPVGSFDSIIADMGVGADSVTVDDGLFQPVYGRGGPGEDTLDGGGGPDDLAGGSAHDTITGGPGDDTLRGGTGPDDLTGGPGDDDIDGQGGADTLFFDDGFGDDSVTDSGSASDRDELDFSAVDGALTGDTAYGDSTVEIGDHRVLYPASAFEDLVGGGVGDTFRFKDREPDGFSVDGGGGGDDLTFLSGNRARRVTVADTGSAPVDPADPADPDSDSLVVLGGSGTDEFLLRAASTQPGVTAEQGFVARLAGDSADRYDYDHAIESLTIDGGVGDDEFTLDDNAASTHIVGGPGKDVVQVGQIYGAADCEPDGADEAVCTDDTDVDSTRGPASGVAGLDTFATRVITRGHLSNGVTHDLVIDGDGGEDRITIFSNHAPVEANGGDDNDQFVARAFIVTASVQLNGDGAIDDFTYAANDQISIDGGAGVDTFTVVGTEGNDGIILAVDDQGRPAVFVCGIDAVSGLPDEGGVCAISAITESIEIFDVLGLEGDDVFEVRGTVASALVTLAGGEHSDRFVVGDGVLDAIDGPVVAAGDESGTVPAIPDPVVLANEDEAPAFDPAHTGGTNVGDTLSVLAGDATDALTGEVTDVAVRGFGMAAGPFVVGTAPDVVDVDEVLAHRDIEFSDITTGIGEDAVTVSGTHAGNDVCTSDGCPLSLSTGAGPDVVDVQSIAGETEVDLGAGEDLVTVGSPQSSGDSLDAIDEHLVVRGGPDSDTLDVDDRADGATRIDLDAGNISRAGLHGDGVSHAAVEFVHVRVGDGDDVVNVRATADDAQRTEVHGNGGDDSFLVSSAAMFDVGEQTDHLGGDVDGIATPLVLHGDDGPRNRVQVSDREAGTGDAAITYDGSTLDGLASATISHDVVGAFGGGVTVWTSEHSDGIGITGTDRSTVSGVRTLTTFNTGDGGDDVEVRLTDGVDGPLALNTEEGVDTVDGSGSTLDLLVFGGLGMDDLTTGSGDDTVFGDLGIASTADGGTSTGRGGPGDVDDGGVQPLDALGSDPSGGDADDIVTGAGADVAVGGTGADDINGGGDNDVLIGGHLSAGAPDTGDAILGGDGGDAIAGDNASFVRSGGSPILTLHDLAVTGVAVTAAASGDDVVSGGPGDDAIFGQDGADDLSGDAGDDVIEGNAGDDTIRGGADQDDLIGGGSALDGVIDDARVWSIEVLGAGLALADGDDEISGDGGADVVLGDNGWIVRPTDAVGTVLTLADRFGPQNPSFDGVVIRDARTTAGGEVTGSYGSDRLRGGEGPDELHGQRDTTRLTAAGNLIAGDELEGGPGDDVLLGDPARVETILEDGTRERVVSDNSPFLDATLHAAGTLTRLVELLGVHAGDDVLLGDAGDDVAHGGGGDDAANGGDGADVAFGGDGDDALWGGPGVDELFGGHGEDSLDVLPRDFTSRTTGKNKSVLGPDPALWFEAAPTADALGGIDIMYGGWDSDEMQADEKSNGPTPGDRLIDWSGAYNRYLSCAKGGGAGSFLRVQSPSLVAFLVDLANGRGAVEAGVAGSSGHRELGLVDSGNTGSVAGEDHVACP